MLKKIPLSRFIYYFKMVNKGYSHCQYKVYQCIRCLSVRVSVCPFVSNNRQNSLTVRAKFFVGPRTIPEFIDAQNYKKLTQHFFDFRKILKIHEQILY